VVLAPLITAYALHYLGPQSQQSASGAATQAPKARLTLIRALGDMVIPQAVSRLPQPPSFPPALAANHCGRWSAWFEKQHAAQAMYPFVVQVAAPAHTDVTVVDVKTTVYRSFKPAAVSYIDCLHGGGPLPGTMVDVNLSHPEARSIVLVQSRPNDLSSPVKKRAMPGAVINISPGHTEYIQLNTLGKGWYYEWSVRLQVVVDQRTETFTFGSPQHPLSTWLGKSPAPAYDYNAADHQWQLTDSPGPA
jgi:hypothetical protein